MDFAVHAVPIPMHLISLSCFHLCSCSFSVRTHLFIPNFEQVTDLLFVRFFGWTKTEVCVLGGHHGNDETPRGDH